MMEDYLAQVDSMKGLAARFLTRVGGVEVDVDKLATVARLEPFHRDAVKQMGISLVECWR